MASNQSDMYECMKCMQIFEKRISFMRSENEHKKLFSKLDQTYHVTFFSLLILA